MKKIIFITLVSLILCSCGIKPKVNEGSDYRIVKIDSIENTYIIYAEKVGVTIKNTDIIKIVSAKTETHCKKNKLITVNKNYKLSTFSLYPKNLVSQHLRGITYNGTVIPFDKDYNIKKDLFITEHIKGLCYKD